MKKKFLSIFIAVAMIFSVATVFTAFSTSNVDAARKGPAIQKTSLKKDKKTKYGQLYKLTVVSKKVKNADKYEICMSTDKNFGPDTAWETSNRGKVSHKWYGPSKVYVKARARVNGKWTKFGKKKCVKIK